MLIVLREVAVFAGEDEVGRLVGAALDLRDDMIEMIAGQEAHTAILAASILLLPLHGLPS